MILESVSTIVARFWEWAGAVLRVVGLEPPFELDLVVLPVLLILGVLTSRDDLRANRISNRHIRWGIYLGLGWLGFLGLHHTFPPGGGFVVTGYQGYPYLFILTLNAILGWALGYLLWHFDLWSAGDGKLFGVLNVLISPGLYRGVLVPYFPGFVLLLNTFLVVFAVIATEFFFKMTVEALQRSRTENKLKRLSKWAKANWLATLKVAVVFLTMLVFIMQTRGFLRREIDHYITLNPVTVYLMLFVLYEPIQRLTRYRWFFGVVSGSLALWVAWSLYTIQATQTGSYREFLSSLIQTSGVMVFIILFSIFYHALSPLFFKNEVPTRSLKPGMVLAKETISVIEGDDNYLAQFSEHVGYLHHTPLTEYSITHLREWYAHQPRRFTSFIEKHIPFAPGLFVGAVLTYFLRGPLLQLL